jgi:hypothetical protein
MSEVTKIDRHEIVQEQQSADPMVSMIERVVMNPDADLDKLERMLAMKERMDAQNASRAYAAALSAARAEIPPIIKDATVDFTSQKGRTHYKHETLAGIAKTIDPILSKHGLSYRFRTDQGNGGVRVTCIVQHMDGHSEETSLSGSPDGSGSKNSFQAVGSAVTYLQRYTLKAALGLSAEVDDDGQEAASRQEQKRDERDRIQREMSHETYDRAGYFDANAAAKRIMAKLNGADTIDDLAARWKSEQLVIAEVKAESQPMYDEICHTKEARKTTISATENSQSPDIDENEIPY